MIDKPKGITSHDVIDRVRRISGIKKVGHGGTLDPNATGLLIIGVGRQATKKLGEITKNTDKTYLATIILGETRDTDDSEGKILLKKNITEKPDFSDVKKILESFVGKIEQMPPQYSAIKIKGKKAYELARKGRKVEIEPRKVEIKKIELKEYEYPLLEIETVVSSGTYIRALARDIGEKLGTGAYLKELRRLKVGEYSVKDALKLDELDKI